MFVHFIEKSRGVRGALRSEMDGGVYSISCSFLILLNFDFVDIIVVDIFV